MTKKLKSNKKSTLEDLVKALDLKTKKQKVDSHAYGEVKSINEDGSYQVALNGSTTTTKCARLAGAKVGDTVFVTILKNGFAVVTNTLGGDTDAADANTKAEEADAKAEDALGAFTSVGMNSNEVFVNSGARGTVTCDFTDVLPDGYNIIGVLACVDLGSYTMGNSPGVCVTGWTVSSSSVSIAIYNAGSTRTYAEYHIDVLCTNLS